MPETTRFCFAVDKETAKKIRQHTDKVKQLEILIAYYTAKNKAEAAERHMSALPDGGVVQRPAERDGILPHRPGEAPAAVTRDADEFSAAETTAAAVEEAAPGLRDIAESTGHSAETNRLSVPARTEPTPVSTVDDVFHPSQRAHSGPVYPTVDPDVRARWADRFTKAREALETLPETKRERLLAQAAALMSGRHQPPPIDRAGIVEGSPEADYAALFDDMAAVIAERMHSEPHPDSWEESPARLLSEELRTAFDTRTVTGLPGGMRTTSHSAARPQAFLDGPASSHREGNDTSRHTSVSGQTAKGPVAPLAPAQIPLPDDRTPPSSHAAEATSSAGFEPHPAEEASSGQALADAVLDDLAPLSNERRELGSAEMALSAQTPANEANKATAAATAKTTTQDHHSIIEFLKNWKTYSTVPGKVRSEALREIDTAINELSTFPRDKYRAHVALEAIQVWERSKSKSIRREAVAELKRHVESLTEGISNSARIFSDVAETLDLAGSVEIPHYWGDLEWRKDNNGVSYADLPREHPVFEAVQRYVSASQQLSPYTSQAGENTRIEAIRKKLADPNLKLSEQDKQRLQDRLSEGKPGGPPPPTSRHMEIEKIEVIANPALWEKFSTAKRAFRNSMAERKESGFSVSPQVAVDRIEWSLGEPPLLDGSARSVQLSTHINDISDARRPTALIPTPEDSRAEVFLFHGTSLEVIDKIREYGFRPDLSANKGTTEKPRYGPLGQGVYVADNASKAQTYDICSVCLDYDCVDTAHPLRQMLLNRVLLGVPTFAHLYQSLRGQDHRSIKPGRTSVVSQGLLKFPRKMGASATNEFLIKDASMLYPELRIFYRVTGSSAATIVENTPSGSSTVPAPAATNDSIALEGFLAADIAKNSDTLRHGARPDVTLYMANIDDSMINGLRASLRERITQLADAMVSDDAALDDPAAFKENVKQVVLDDSRVQLLSEMLAAHLTPGRLGAAESGQALDPYAGGLFDDWWRTHRLSGAQPAGVAEQHAIETHFEQRNSVAAVSSGTAQETSPSLTAKVGFEIEIPGVNLDYPSRGEILVQGTGWRLETDRSGAVSNVEFVFAPMSDLRDIISAGEDIIGMINRMRTLALSKGSRQVVISEAATGSLRPYTVLKDQIATVHDLQFGGRLQVTYGVVLADVAAAIDDLLTAKQAAAIHRKVARIEELRSARKSTPLSPDARGFIELVTMYLERADARSHHGGTVHSLFRMMSRSDFTSIYDRLLSPVDRQQIRELIVPDGESGLPILMEALGIDAEKLVFRTPYKAPLKTSPMSGPTVSDWLKSIVYGRADGSIRKDLLSPPPGIPPHSGDLDVDYGMGAMGVDEQNKAVLFEVRGAPYRPEHISLNGRILSALAIEYGKAAHYNSSLPKFSIPPQHHMGAVDRIADMHASLLSTYQAVIRVGEEPTAVQNNSFRRNLIASGKILTDAGQELRGTGRFADLLTTASETVSHIEKLGKSPDLLLTSQHRHAWLSTFTDLLNLLAQSLWAAGDGLGHEISRAVSAPLSPQQPVPNMEALHSAAFSGPEPVAFLEASRTGAEPTHPGEVKELTRKQVATAVPDTERLLLLDHGSLQREEFVQAPDVLQAGSLESTPVGQGEEDLLAAFADKVRPAVRLWDRPVTEEFKALQNILRSPGSRSLVFGLVADGPVWAVNMSGTITWQTNSLEPLSPPDFINRPVFSIDIDSHGQLTGPAARRLKDTGTALPEDVKTDFCDLNFGTDIHKILK
ncbi:hypothetical protein KBZ94_41060 [Streptomyces sp. RM72]|uniref:hypothetical protein n=1 Tax=Streptomyces sp. RM72 TaxID=1115510 RepID=UPI001B382CCA|nr:hypothetical protein [Streptomyces sp. RM72]MBQ0891234.1 hypothetical protein [Streptomyces sp. RM72]